MSYTVEVCCFTYEDVCRAQRAGATRIELCADRASGGITPSYGMIEHVLATIPTDMTVMIRPRGGDFLYSDGEMKIMQKDIAMAARLGVEGVVFGVLDDQGFLDIPKMRALIDTAREHELKITCHRAFDRTQDPYRALDELIELGVDRLLTSGQQPTGIQGLPLVEELVKIAGDKLDIMCGGGVKSSHIELMLAAGITHIHTGSTETIQSKMQTKQPGLYMGDPARNDDIHIVVNEKDVARIVEAVKRKAGQA